jgi:uncharacterized membrane protein YqjE
VRDERSVLNVLNDIVGNIQDILRSEIRLAKTEAAGELLAAKSAALGFTVALLATAFSIMFLLLSAMFALRIVLTTWGAALVVAAATGLIGGTSFILSARRARRQRNPMAKTTASIKENLEWAKQSTK